MHLTPPPDLVRAAPARLDRAAVALIVLTMLAPLVLYFGTAKSIVDIWNSSETFAHGYIILPISLWLIWRRRANFGAYPPTPWWPALVPLALAGAGWLLGSMADVNVVQHYMLAAMLPLTAWSLFGRRLATSLAFPLLFVLAAVPFGEIFIAPLISFTADFTVRALQLTGIPVLRNGTMFEIPSGSWSVVEACSGVRYLISSVTLGMLYAYLTFRSFKRRAAFMAAAVLVPIIANGLRAYMIVMIGHLSGMKLAVGVDHLIYGWLFFGLVMFLMFWIGNIWRDDGPISAPAPVPPAEGPRRGAAALLPMTAAVLALLAVWPALGAYMVSASHNPKPVQLAPVAVAWEPVPAFSSWTPAYMAPDARFDGVYRSAGKPVALTLLYYRNQRPDKTLISSVNRLTAEHDPWHQTATAGRVETIGGKPFTLRESRLTGPQGTILVWHWNWIDQRATANDYAAKLWQASAKLRLRPDDGATVMLSAPFAEHPDEARAALRAFLNANIAPVEAALASTRAR